MKKRPGRHTGELSETTGVVVAESLGVTKGLENGVGLENLVLQLINRAHGPGAANCGQEPHDMLAALSLSSTRLAAKIKEERKKERMGKG